MADKKLTKEDLINKQLEIVSNYENAYNVAPFELKGLAKEVLHVQRSILRKMGYREPTQPKKKYSKKGFFKRNKPNTREVDGLEVDTNVKTINNKAKKGFFKQKDKPTVPTSPKIENKAKKGLFKAKDIVEDKELPKKKANPRRLTQDQSNAIKELANEGYNIKQISNKLMIAEEKVTGLLQRVNKGKGGGNLITTSAKDLGDNFKTEVEDYEATK